jgi:hypothetical protein
MNFRQPPSPDEVLAELEPFIPVAYAALDAGCQSAATFFREISPKRRRPKYDPDLHPHLVRFFAKREFTRARIRARGTEEDATIEIHPLRLNGLRVDRGRYRLRVLKAHEGGLPPVGSSEARLQFYQQRIAFGEDYSGNPNDIWNLVILWHLTRTFALDSLSLVCPRGGGVSSSDLYWQVPIPHPVTTVRARAVAAADDDDLGITYASTSKSGEQES